MVRLTMKVTFRDSHLELIHTDRAHELGLPFAVIKAARAKLVLLEAAPDERTLRNWKSLNFKKLEGFADGRRQVRINAQYRIVLLLSNAMPPEIEVLEIGDPH